MEVFRYDGQFLLLFCFIYILRRITKYFLVTHSSSSRPGQKSAVSSHVPKLLLVVGHKVLDRLSALQFFVHGPRLLQDSYKKVCRTMSMAKRSSAEIWKDVPYIVATPGRKIVLLSSPAHVKELSEAPETHLSLHGVAAEVRLFTEARTVLKLILPADVSSQTHDVRFRSSR